MVPIDIRLLSVFDEIYKCRSVTGAAAALDLGQPAVSVALQKLRLQFSDQLLERVGRQARGLVVRLVAHAAPPVSQARRPASTARRSATGAYSSLWCASEGLPVP